MVYKVKLDVFEGPFDLLVYLIENAEMSIYDIQLSEITKQYMEYIEDMQRRDIVLAGEFMILAATLIEIKSKMLLPRNKFEEDEEGFEDPRSELVEKLLEYKQYKNVAAYLQEQEEINNRIYVKPKEDLSIYTKEPDVFLNLDLIQFIKAFDMFLRRRKKIEEVKNNYTRIKRQEMSMETKIEQMKRILTSRRKLRFRDLLGGVKSRYNVILTFVSLLELIKLKSVKVEQKTNFGEISIIANEIDTQQAEGA
ncbi:MAG: segregation/condensation protein A [Clostridiales bacterium]|jgi:segregation and condensation protein A|nr:segregation/condensation protein A [Clostridiales bacterium]